MNEQKTLTKGRLESLDILRGLTVTFMCMVNNPGTWSHMYAPLKHAAWFGCTPTDLIYPFFIFCMGCAMAFSLSKFDGNGKAGIWKIIKRSLAIFAIGFALNLYPFFPTDNGHLVFGWDNWVEWLQGKRIFGVLQRIACSYLIAGLLIFWLKTPKKVGIAIAALCVAYTAILVAFGTEPGPFTLEGTISRKIDVALLGDSHVYHGYSFDDGTRAAFDPEGPLGAMTGAASCLLGYLIGLLVRKDTKAGTLSGDTASRVFVFGMVSLAAAELLSIWVPISKALWTPSYVLYAGGWAMIALAFFIYCVDVKGIKKPFKPFKVMGMNAMMAFILSAVIVKSYQFFHYSTSTWFGANDFLSFCHSVLFALIILGLLWILYHKKIFVKL